MKKSILIILLGLLIFSCVKDDTVTDFKELNEVTIEGIESNYSVLLQSNLQISPQITTSKNDDSNLSYLWYLRRTSGAISKDTISFERNLDVVMVPQFVEPGVDYTLTFKVTDNTSGVYYREETSLQVFTPYTKGTLLLCKENGVAEVNFLNYEEERSLVENVFAKANEGLNPGDNPLNIYAINPNPFRIYMKNVFIACNNATGGYYLDPQTFEIDIPFNEAFEKIPEVNPITTRFYKKYGQIEYIIMNGEVRKRATNSGAFDWEIPCVFLEGEPEYAAAPFILPYPGLAIFFDEANQRFFKHEPYNKGLLSPIDTLENNTVFSPNHVGDNLKLVAWGRESGNIQSFWALMRNTLTQRLKVYKFTIQYDNNTRTRYFVSREIVEINESAAPNIYQAEWFSANDEVYDILMYATKDKVYSLNMHEIDSETSSQLEAIQIDASTANMEITKMEFVEVQVSDPTENDPLNMRDANQIRLSVLDHKLSSRKGGFSLYEVTTTGGLHSNLVYLKTGFCDEVIDIEEKYD